MRWQIKTEVTDSKTTTQGNRQITTKNLRTTRTQYITVGDIVGAAKSATGAVKNVVARLPAYINQFRNNPDAKSQAQAATGQMIMNIATPLAAIIKGAEVYKTIMKVIGILTPIMKLVARGTGVWCSPGNVADIAEIVMGTVQQILIALITQAIIRLKEWIWNFEFELRNISSDASVIITKILRNSSDKLNKKIYDNVFNNVNNWYRYSSSDNSLSSKASNTILDELDRIANGGIGGGTGNVNLTDGALNNLLDGKRVNDNGEVIEFGNGWQTEFPLNDIKVREFRGSLNDGGIQYSILNDSGKVEWVQSNKTDGSFCCFCKLNMPDGHIRYLAGSSPYISVDAIIPVSDGVWSKDTYRQYNKDYYTYENKKKLKTHKLTKSDKDRYVLETYRNLTTLGLFDKDSNYKPALGVWYSDDNGETWAQTQIQNEYIGCMYEYKEKVGYPETVVISSYDYKGLRYTVDGYNYDRCELDEKDLDHGRFVLLTANDNNKVRTYNDGIEASGKVDGGIRVLIKTGGKPIKAGAKVRTKIDMLNTSPFHNVWKKITDLIHYKHSDILSTFTEVAWQDLRSRVFAGEYTWEDAINDYPE